ncbi:SH3 domain-containing protein [Streptomyces sp. NPDC054796]
MTTFRLKRRVTAGVAGLVLTGSALLAATPALASDTASGVAPASASAARGSTSAKEAGTVSALPRGKVVSRITLNIREQPTTHAAYLGGLAPGTVVALYCKVRGQNVDGNNLWYVLGGPKPGYVAARYVKNLSHVDYCES